MNDKYNRGLEISASNTALKHTGVWGRMEDGSFWIKFRTHLSTSSGEKHVRTQPYCPFHKNTASLLLLCWRMEIYCSCFSFCSSPQRGSPKKFAIKSVGLSEAAWRSKVRKQRGREPVWTPSPEQKLCLLFMRMLALLVRLWENYTAGAGQMNCFSPALDRNGCRQSTVLPRPRAPLQLISLSRVKRKRRGLDLSSMWEEDEGLETRESRRLSGGISSVFR